MRATSDRTVRTSKGPDGLPSSAEAAEPRPFFADRGPSLRGLKGTSKLVYAVLDALGNAAEHFGAAGRHQHIVLDADAAQTGQIDAGLDGHDHAGPKHLLTARPQEWRLMNF